MKIEQGPFLDFLGQPKARFVIPVFQRVYSWNARQCEELWEDIMSAGDAGETHFMGIVLYSVDAESWAGHRQLDVIDGQQRMTTLTLLIAALCNRLAEAGGKVAGLSVPVVQHRFLKASGGAAESSKLVLSNLDRATLMALVGAGDPPEEPAQRLIDNLQLFERKMSAERFDPERLWRGLEALAIASVQLEAEDSPQIVFESLNSKGMPLTLADRVKNYLIASTGNREQERLYKSYWVPLEETTAESDGLVDITAVLHAWLADRYRSVRIFDKSEVYGVFKTCLRDEFGGSFERLLADVTAYCGRYLADPEFREEAAALAERWVSDKPEESISELKLFGD